jgi:hypothetical protein
MEQRLGLFEVCGVEALGEPTVDPGEHRARSWATTLVAIKRTKLIVGRSSESFALAPTYPS